MTKLYDANLPLPSLQNVAEAAAAFHRIKKPMSPLLKASDRLNERIGYELYLKAECCTEGGSFKLHGAMNYLRQIEADIGKKGVVAYSSGNHATGVAIAARKFGYPATVFVPGDLPAIKRHKIELYGANIVTYNRLTDDRATLAAGYTRQHNAVLIPPFDHPWTIAGQGVIGLEILCQAAKENFQPDLVVTPCGGGGLASGLALSLLSATNAPGLVICEPSDFNDAQKLLMKGAVEPNPVQATSLCDALQSPQLGRIPAVVLRQFMAKRSLRSYSIGDEFVRCAMALAWREFSLALEPSGAIAFATAIKFRKRFKGKKLVVIASGGNVDPEPFRRHCAWGVANMEKYLNLRL